MASHQDGSACDKITISFVALTWAATLSALPLYSKLLLSGGLGFPKFQYPITFAWMQLGTASVCLCIANAVMRHVDLSPGSWILGPYFRYKVRHICASGITFGLHYAVQDLAIQLIDNDTHALLNSTRLVWVVLSARIVNKEKPSVLEVLALVICLVGTFLISLNAVHEVGRASVIPIVVNLCPPLLGGFAVAFLRKGVLELNDPNNVLEGAITKTEITGIKLLTATLTALISSIILEGQVMRITKAPADPFWVALGQTKAKAVVLMMASGLIMFTCHVCLTWLAQLLSVTSVGIISCLAVWPQWGLNLVCAALGAHVVVSVSFRSFVGAFTVLLGATLYALALHFSRTKGKLMMRNWQLVLVKPTVVNDSALSLQDSDQRSP